VGVLTGGQITSSSGDVAKKGEEVISKNHPYTRRKKGSQTPAGAVNAVWGGERLCAKGHPTPKKNEDGRQRSSSERPNCDHRKKTKGGGGGERPGV